MRLQGGHGAIPAPGLQPERIWTWAALGLSFSARPAHHVYWVLRLRFTRPPALCAAPDSGDSWRGDDLVGVWDGLGAAGGSTPAEAGGQGGVATGAGYERGAVPSPDPSGILHRLFSLNKGQAAQAARDDLCGLVCALSRCGTALPLGRDLHDTGADTRGARCEASWVARQVPGRPLAQRGRDCAIVRASRGRRCRLWRWGAHRFDGGHVRQVRKPGAAACEQRSGLRRAVAAARGSSGRQDDSHSPRCPAVLADCSVHGAPAPTIQSIMPEKA